MPSDVEESGESTSDDKEEEASAMGGNASTKKCLKQASSGEEDSPEEEEDEEVTFSTSADASDASLTNGGKRKAPKDSWKYRRRKKMNGESTPEMPSQPLRRSSRLSSSDSSSGESSDHLGTRSWSKQSSRRVSASSVNNGNIMPKKNNSNGRRSEKHMDADTFHLLTDFYQANPYPTNKEFLTLEKKTKMSPKRLMYWFSNRRRRDGTAVRRVKKDVPDSSNDVSEDLFAKDLGQVDENKVGKDQSAVGQQRGLDEPSLVEAKTNVKKKRGRPLGSFSSLDSSSRRILDDFYHSNAFPSSSDIRTLVQSTGLDGKKIKYFFSRKRARDGLSNDVEKAVGPLNMGPPRESNEDGVASGEAIGTLDTFACLIDKCDYSSHCRWNLTRHLRGNHDIDPWACKRCMRFYRPGEATNHPCGTATKVQVKKVGTSSEKPCPSSSASASSSRSKGDGSIKDLMSSLSRAPSGKKVAEAAGVDTVMVSYAENSLFRRSGGRLEVVMVNHDQFDAVQRFIQGTAMVS
jgi:hypothetical protein